MHGTSAALFDCLNPDCWCPGGQAELPSNLDGTQEANEAQTDWPICEHCFEPLSLLELVTPDEDLLRALAEEAFEQADIAALVRLRAICTEMIVQYEVEKAGEGGDPKHAAPEDYAFPLPRPHDSTPPDKTTGGLSRFGTAVRAFLALF